MVGLYSRVHRLSLQPTTLCGGNGSKYEKDTEWLRGSFGGRQRRPIDGLFKTDSKCAPPATDRGRANCLPVLRRKGEREEAEVRPLPPPARTVILANVRSGSWPFRNGLSLTRCLSCSCQSSREQFDAGDHYPSMSAFDRGFKILDEAPASVELERRHGSGHRPCARPHQQ
jgi:hypothetical protein